jgi:hypothetical protein
MLPEPDYAAFFHRYADAYQRSLGDHVEADLIRSFFADTVMALSTSGALMPGENDDSFARTLEQGYDFAKAIGTVSMEADRVEVDALAENHDRVRVFYTAGYRRRDGAALTIPFSIVYLLQRRADGPKIFAFIAGDEMGLYRQHGLVDAEGNPA